MQEKKDAISPKNMWVKASIYGEFVCLTHQRQGYSNQETTLVHIRIADTSAGYRATPG